MAKKKEKTIINNIQELNLEIDYDKLADAIVKAEEKKSKVEQTENSQKECLIKAIWRILRNKKDTQGILMSSAFSMLISFTFKAIAIVGFLVCLLVLGTAIFVFCTSVNPWWTNIIPCSFFVMAVWAVFLCMVMLWGAANEIEKEKDKNYIVAVFSGLVSLAALVVALIALFKEVG